MLGDVVARATWKDGVMDDRVGGEGRLRSRPARPPAEDRVFAEVALFDGRTQPGPLPRDGREGFEAADPLSDLTADGEVRRLEQRATLRRSTAFARTARVERPGPAGRDPSRCQRRPVPRVIAESQPGVGSQSASVKAISDPRAAAIPALRAAAGPACDSSRTTRAAPLCRQVRGCVGGCVVDDHGLPDAVVSGPVERSQEASEAGPRALRAGAERR